MNYNKLIQMVTSIRAAILDVVVMLEQMSTSLGT